MGCRCSRRPQITSKPEGKGDSAAKDNAAEVDLEGGVARPVLENGSAIGNASLVKPAVGGNNAAEVDLEGGVSRPGLENGSAIGNDSLLKLAVAGDEVPAPTTPFGLANDQIDLLLSLFRAARVYEAMGLLQTLQLSPDEAVQASLRTRLSGEAVLSKVPAVHEAVQRAMEYLMGPSMRTDIAWPAIIDMTDDQMGKDFTLDFRIRWTDDKEYEPSGPSSQMIARSTVSNFPLSFSRYCAFVREADLSKKEWIQDCAKMSAQLGGYEQLSQTMVQVLLWPPMLPFGLQETLIRSFAFFEQPPLPELGSSGAGILVLEENPPEGAVKSHGFDLFPPAHKRAVSIRGTSKLLWVTPNIDGKGVNMTVAVRLGVAISPWILPLSLLKLFVAHAMKKSLRLIKENVIDHWEDFDFDSRMAASAEFYKRPREIEQGVQVLAI